MASLKDTLINGALRVLGKIYGTLSGVQNPYVLSTSMASIASGSYYKFLKVSVGFRGRIVLVVSRYGEATKHLAYLNIVNPGSDSFGSACVIFESVGTSSTAAIKFAKVSSSDHNFGIVLVGQSSTSTYYINESYIEWCNDQSLITYEYTGTALSSMSDCGYAGTEYSPEFILYS